MLVRWWIPLLLAGAMLQARAAEALLIGGAAYVPIRDVAVWLGGAAAYDAASGDIRIHLPAGSTPDGVALTDLEALPLTVRVRSGSAVAWVDEPRWLYVDPDAPAAEGPVALDLPTPVLLRGGVSYLPARGVAPLLRGRIAWVPATRTLVIEHPRARQNLRLTAREG